MFKQDVSTCIGRLSLKNFVKHRLYVCLDDIANTVWIGRVHNSGHSHRGSAPVPRIKCLECNRRSLKSIVDIPVIHVIAFPIDGSFLPLLLTADQIWHHSDALVNIGLDLCLVLYSCVEIWLPIFRVKHFVQPKSVVTSIVFFCASK